jgi:hypothetical protein
MAQQKARRKQLQRLNKPKKPVVLLKGNKKKPKVVIGPRAGIPPGLAEAARKAKAKKKLPRPKNPAPPFPNEQGEFDAASKVGVSERSTLE